MAVIISSIIIAISIIAVGVVINKIANHFDGVANMFFAIQLTQLRIELDELGYECPEWIKVLDNEEQPLDTPPPTELRLVKAEKDKPGEE